MVPSQTHKFEYIFTSEFRKYFVVCIKVLKGSKTIEEFLKVVNDMRMGTVYLKLKAVKSRTVSAVWLKIRFLLRSEILKVAVKGNSHHSKNDYRNLGVTNKDLILIRLHGCISWPIDDEDGGNDLRLCVQKSVNFAESEPLIFVFFSKNSREEKHHVSRYLRGKTWSGLGFFFYIDWPHSVFDCGIFTFDVDFSLNIVNFFLFVSTLILKST